MNIRTSQIAGRRALAALFATTMVVSGAAVVAPPLVSAQTQTQAPTESVNGEKPRGTAEGNGNGTFFAGAAGEIPTVEPGGLLTVGGTGFDQRPAEGGTLAFKLNDGTTLKFPSEQEGADVVEVEADGTAYIEGENLPGADGAWTANIRIPENLEPGAYWVRILGGADSGPGLSKYAWFTVGTEAEEETPSESAFEQKCAAIPSGLYQSAYSESENAIYVTRAVGRPPVTQSSLMKYDADTLELIKETIPPVADEEKQGLFAVYGVGLDEAKKQVWVTNTRQNTVAVYSSETLELIKQYDEGLVNHSRDVIVDPQTHKVYVTSANRGNTDSGSILVFDGNDLEAAPTEITIPGFGTTMSLDIDPATGELFTVSLSHPKAVKIDTRNDNAQTVYDLPAEAVKGGSGISYDPSRKNIWIASQESGNAYVYNVESKTEVANKPSGEGALNAKYDAVYDVVYVTNRVSGTVSVFNAKTQEFIEDLPAGETAELGGLGNHTSVDGRGNAYSVNKLTPEEGENAGTNQLCRITPTGLEKAPGDDDSTTGSIDGLLGSLQGAGSADLPGGAGLIGAAGGLAIAGILFGGLIHAANTGLIQLPFELPGL